MTNDYTISENFTLPSLGKIYNTEVNPTVTLACMTTAHEMRRCSATDTQYLNMCEIIDDCIVNDIGISSYDMCLGDYQFLLHKLRVVTYGSDYKIKNNCPYCMSENNGIIDLNALDVREYTDNVLKYTECDLPCTKKHIKLKMQTPRMLDKIFKETKDFKKKTSGMDRALVFTVCELIDKIDGKEPDRIALEDWVMKLPMADTNKILMTAQKFNESIGIDNNISNICDVCGLPFTSKFKMTAEFFRPSLDL